MRKLLIVLLLIALLVGGWYFVTPWWAMKSLSDAAEAGDMAAIEEKVDFPALRASVSDQISEATVRRAGQWGPIDRLGAQFADRIGREVVHRAITPENVGLLAATGTLAGGFLPERLRGQEIAWDVEREGFDRFRAVGTFEDGTGGPILLFGRDGLGWKLTGIELP